MSDPAIEEAILWAHRLAQGGEGCGVEFVFLYNQMHFLHAIPPGTTN
jgi:hypothetical protein